MGKDGVDAEPCASHGLAPRVTTRGTHLTSSSAHSPSADVRPLPLCARRWSITSTATIATSFATSTVGRNR